MILSGLANLNTEIVNRQIADKSYQEKEQIAFIQSMITEFESSEAYALMRVAQRYYENDADAIRDKKRMVIAKDMENNAVLKESKQIDEGLMDGLKSMFGRVKQAVKDGVSDVIKALLEILEKRYDAKYKTNDPKTIIRVVAEMPITPAEATIKVDANKFPVTTLTERLVQLDTNPNELDSIKVGSINLL